MPPRFSPELFEKLYGSKQPAPEVKPAAKPDPAPDTRTDEEKRRVRDRIYQKALNIASLIDQSIAIGIELHRKPNGAIPRKAVVEDILANEMGCLMIVAKCYATRTSLRLHPDTDAESPSPDQRLAMNQREAIRLAIEDALCDALSKLEARVDAGEFD